MQVSCQSKQLSSIFNYTLTLFDYPLHWVLCSYDYLLYTANTAYVQDYYPVLQSVLNDFYPSVTDEHCSTKTLTGLRIMVTTPSLIDPIYLATIIYSNVLALQNTASIATVVGNDQDSASWSKRARTVSTAINNRL